MYERAGTSNLSLGKAQQADIHTVKIEVLRDLGDNSGCEVIVRGISFPSIGCLSSTRTPPSSQLGDKELDIARDGR